MILTFPTFSYLCQTTADWRGFAIMSCHCFVSWLPDVFLPDFNYLMQELPLPAKAKQILHPR